MENEKFVINAAAGTQEIIIREGAAEKVLDPKAPLELTINGQLSAVYEFLSKRLDKGQFAQQDCRIIVNRENVNMRLLINERDAYNFGCVTGELTLNNDYAELGVNQGNQWTPAELGMYFKMHRYWFNDRNENMKIVSTLSNYKADISQKVEKSIEQNGNSVDCFAQVVNSNLPEKITLNIPIFKGMKPAPIEVEFFAKVNGREVSFVLISPGAIELLEDFRNKAIDEQLAKIREIAPDIAIIEK